MAPCPLPVSDQPAFWHLDAARGHPPHHSITSSARASSVGGREHSRPTPTPLVITCKEASNAASASLAMPRWLACSGDQERPPCRPAGETWPETSTRLP